MASDITPGNIDGTFPIAGIDNDSQGFRTNFTNTSTNFTNAKTEIEELQANSILKVGVGGDAVDNDMAGEVLQAATLIDTRETVFAHGEIAGAFDIDHQNGQYQTASTANAGGSQTWAFTNFPATTFGRVRVEVTIADIADTVTIPTGFIGADIINGYATGIITFAATGTYIFEFTSSDMTTYSIQDLSRESTPLIGFNTQVGTTYPIVLSDAGLMITMDNGGANNATIPDNAVIPFPIGTELNFMQLGAGVTTILITTDTLNSRGALVALNGQFAVATALKVTATTWTLSGDLA